MDGTVRAVKLGLHRGRAAAYATEPVFKSRHAMPVHRVKAGARVMHFAPRPSRESQGIHLNSIAARYFIFL